MERGGETANPLELAKELGNGAEISAQDMVPFCIWNAGRSLDDDRQAFLSTIELDCDCDTNAAIVGGIVKRGEESQRTGSACARA